MIGGRIFIHDAETSALADDLILSTSVDKIIFNI